MNEEELAGNPFLVLEVSVSATRMEVERAGQKLLAQLAIGVASVKRYRTPFGTVERDETKVRAALAALRDPERRALYELWIDDSSCEGERERVSLPSWAGALASIGWRGPWAD